METPIVFIIFNRPDTTAVVFEEIRQARPTQLFVIADGPRLERDGEAAKCHETRQIIEGVDWECEVFKNYSDVNLGCRDRVSSGLNWVFDRVESAIILEDDCVPHQSFFPFCQEMLAKYIDDERIMVVAGDNYQFGKSRTNYSYYFSRYNHCWGWATWKRAWQHYDRDMNCWPEVRDGKLLDSILDDPISIQHWEKIFYDTYHNRNNSWAYRWTLSCWVQSGLTILPDVNLVSNIGFGMGATHTTGSQNKLANLRVDEMVFPLQHPRSVIRHFKADKFTENNVFMGRETIFKKTLAAVKYPIKMIIAKIKLGKPETIKSSSLC
jgi:hypothetical protein